MHYRAEELSNLDFSEMEIGDSFENKTIITLVNKQTNTNGELVCVFDALEVATGAIHEGIEMVFHDGEYQFLPTSLN